MRRANGTGSIVNLGPNRRRRYAVRVSYLEREGVWKQRYLSYHATVKEAQAALDSYLQKKVPVKTLATTWGEVYTQWSAKKYEKAGSASIASYIASWKRLSALADKEMFRITIDDLQSIIDRDEKDGLSKSSISNDKMLMKALYKHAMERDIVTKDYSAFVELPTVGAKMEKGAFTEAQITQLKMLAEEGFLWADTVLMLCYTGFRVSEFLSLTKDSYHADGDYLQGGMKTAAGKDRIVPVHPAIHEYLDRWLAKGGKTIICKEDGSALNANRYRSLFASVAEEIGTPQATPHWCRHTAASRMKIAGVDDLAARRILGHSDKDITEHYTHVDINFLRGEIVKIPWPL